MSMTSANVAAAPAPVAHDPPYMPWLASVSKRFAHIAQSDVRLFTTDAGKDAWTGLADRRSVLDSLFDLFLVHMPEHLRQEYNCHTCRRFFEVYGSLVTIDEDGSTTSVFWDATEAPDVYLRAVTVLQAHVERAVVTGVFLSSERKWGQATTGQWHHLAVVPPPALVFKVKIKTADQEMAEKLEDYKMLNAALLDFPETVVKEAQRLLTVGGLYRSEKCIDVANTFSHLHQQLRLTEHKRHRHNLRWRYVAYAPAGFCHIRSGMIGTLLEDVEAGLPFADIKRRFDAKMNPLQYQRPQAAPTAGNLVQAEKVVAQLQSSGALARRYATLDDIQEKLWVPTPWEQTKAPAAAGPVFGHLQPKGTAPVKDVRVATPAMTMTWEKFLRTVLPGARKMECRTVGHFYALTTAVHPAAPPILQWDNEERRNPVAWYTRSSSTSAGWFYPKAPEYADVEAVTLLPFLWHEGKGNHGKGVLFVLRGCQDSRSTDAAIFPEVLKSDYHPIRASIEAFSKNAKVAGKQEASACGVVLREGTNPGAVELRVTDLHGAVSSYKLDRWD